MMGLAVRSSLRALVLGALAFAHSADGAHPQTYEPMLAAIAGEFAGRYSAFADATWSAKDAVTELCAAPSIEGLERAREAFREALYAWGPVAFVRFGSVAIENRFERILFWPDARDRGLRQVQRLLAEEDESATVPGRLAEKSVAAQGLPALEYALFGDGSEAVAGAEGAFRCRFAGAVAENLATMAAAVSQAWAPRGEAHTAFSTAGAGSGPYRSPVDAVGEALDAIYAGTEAITSLILKPALGTDQNSARPNRFPFHRSGSSLAFLRAEIEGMRGLAAHLARSDELSPDKRPIADTLNFLFADALAAISSIDDQPVAAAVRDPGARTKLADLVVALEGLHRTLRDQLTPALGVIIRFNQLDSD